MNEPKKNSLTITAQWEGGRILVGCSHGNIQMSRAQAVELYASFLHATAEVIREVANDTFDGEDFFREVTSKMASREPTQRIKRDLNNG